MGIHLVSSSWVGGICPLILRFAVRCTALGERMSEIGFENRVAVITGAGGGLGKTYALELAKRGAKVVVNDLGGHTDGTGASTLADQTVAQIKSAGGEAIANFDSVSTPEGGENIIKAAVDTW